MGQLDVYNFLKKNRKNTDKYFTVNEIKEGMLKEGYNSNLDKTLHSDLLRLATFKQIQCKGIGFWNHQKVFRGYK